MKKIFAGTILPLAFILISLKMQDQPIKSSTSTPPTLIGYSIMEIRPVGNSWVGIAMKCDAYNNSEIQFSSSTKPVVGAVADFTQPVDGWVNGEYILL